jgi:hypothetical protein
MLTWPESKSQCINAVQKCFEEKEHQLDKESAAEETALSCVRQTTDPKMLNCVRGARADAKQSLYFFS